MTPRRVSKTYRFSETTASRLATVAEVLDLNETAVVEMGIEHIYDIIFCALNHESADWEGRKFASKVVELALFSSTEVHGEITGEKEHED